MKEFYKVSSVGILCLCLSISALPVRAQVQTARNISTGPASNGFYEYLPAGYGSGSQTYPLMVFIHGVGELGNGGSDLSTVLRNGPPKLINQGTFPTSFTVNGNTFSFIVLSPQFVYWPASEDIDAVINYAVAHYRVDPKRIYLTGLSMGGGVTWDYAAYSGHANKLAALLPISGAEELGAVGAKAIAVENLPVYALHNNDDPTVPSSYTVDNVNLINTSNPAPSPKAIDTIFPVSGHDAWSKAYNPSFVNPRIGLNVYQWLLQYSTDGIVSGPLPVKLTDYKAALSTNGSQVTVSWATSIEQDNNYFLVERSPDGKQFTAIDTVAGQGNTSIGHQYAAIDHAPLYGDNFYRLSQVDQDGKTTFYTVLKITVTTSTQALIRLSPNPAGSTIFLELAYPETGNMQVNLSDVQGRVLKGWQLKKEGAVLDQYLDISSLPPGSYFIHIQGNKTHEVRQFIRK